MLSSPPPPDQRMTLVLVPNPGLEGYSAAWGMAFLGTFPAFRDPVGELVTQVLEAPVPEERPRLCQVLSGHHLDLIPLLTFSKNVTLKG